MSRAVTCEALHVYINSVPFTGQLLINAQIYIVRGLKMNTLANTLAIESLCYCTRRISLYTNCLSIYSVESWIMIYKFCHRCFKLNCMIQIISS